MRPRARFKIRCSRRADLWYVFDRLTGTVVTAPTHDEAMERCRMLAGAATEPTA